MGASSIPPIGVGFEGKAGPALQAYNLKEKKSVDVLPFTKQAPESVDQGKPDAIPDHVWQTLQDAGSAASERLLALLTGKSFERLKAGDQARLIQLALDRAYGPPVKASMSLQLSGSVSDAVAESLGRLASHDLPEMRRKAPSRDVGKD